MTLLVSMVCLAVRFPYGLGSVIWFGPYWFCWTLGCAVAELESSRIKLTIDSFKFVAWLSISALGFGLWLSEFRPFAFSCVGCFWALLILRCLTARAADARFLPLTLMANLGIISYSLYAVHAPVCLFARSVLFHGAHTTNILYTLPVIAACIAAAACLFFLVERYSLQVPAWLRRSESVSHPKPT